jgi:hypothetical protein
MAEDIREHPIPENETHRVHGLCEETKFKIDREEGFNESRGY